MLGYDPTAESSIHKKETKGFFCWVNPNPLSLSLSLSPSLYTYVYIYIHLYLYTDITHYLYIYIYISIYAPAVGTPRITGHSEYRSARASPGSESLSGSLRNQRTGMLGYDPTAESSIHKKETKGFFCWVNPNPLSLSLSLSPSLYTYVYIYIHLYLYTDITHYLYIYIYISIYAPAVGTPRITGHSEYRSARASPGSESLSGSLRNQRTGMLGYDPTAETSIQQKKARARAATSRRSRRKRRSSSRNIHLAAS